MKILASSFHLTQNDGTGGDDENIPISLVIKQSSKNIGESKYYPVIKVSINREQLTIINTSK